MTSYSGLWNNEYGQNYSVLSDAVHAGNDRTALARIFSGRNYGRGVTRSIITALLGAEVGDDAQLTFKRVAAERDLAENVQGGKRVIESVVAIDRATTADDYDLLSEALEQNNRAKPSYPKDRAGNGGGSKLGW